MRTVEVQGNRLVVKSSATPAKRLTTEERLAIIEAEHADLKGRLARLEKVSKPPA